MCQALPGALKEETLPFLFAVSWLLRMASLVCAPCRRGGCSRVHGAARREATERGHGERPRREATERGHEKIRKKTRTPGALIALNSVATEFATLIKECASAPIFAALPHMPHRAHYTALRARTHLSASCTTYSIRTLRACARLRASLVILTCTRATLLGYWRVCCLHRGRATDSRVHARGLFA